MNIPSVAIFSLTALSVACVTREHNENAATQSQTQRNANTVQGVSLRGSHNNWEAEPMLKQALMFGQLILKIRGLWARQPCINL